MLHPPSVAERDLIEQAIAQALPHFPAIVQGDMASVMNELHRR